ncbi:MAG TPA: J domain-containing protein [Phycisphaerales bacterium]|nr:J domain-containing protein [Phycisphaerales bacterium]
METPLTHYQVLGVLATASAGQIRRAYRDLARRLHPDVNAAAAAHSAFLRVQAAYEALSDPTRRAEYDRSLAGANGSGHTAGPEPHYTWTNIGGRATRGRTTGVVPTDLDDLYDAFFGGRSG